MSLDSSNMIFPSSMFVLWGQFAISLVVLYKSPDLFWFIYTIMSEGLYLSSLIFLVDPCKRSLLTENHTPCLPRRIWSLLSIGHAWIYTNVEFSQVVPTLSSVFVGSFLQTYLPSSHSLAPLLLHFVAHT